ncbi:MAG: formyl transferase [Hyphomicrobiaceae bacterium]|nr:formyl transferase [Hyphomicrobiaceae bacterium]
MREQKESPSGERGIVVLMAGGPLGWSVVNGLIERVGPVTVIEEDPESKRDIIKRRLRLAGPVATAGQIAFGVWLRLFARRAQRRIDEIRALHGLNPAPVTVGDVHRVATLNSDEARQLLMRLKPKVVAVYGTRLLSRKTLGAVDAPFINYHAGINPKYRGQHPAYWALAAGDAANAGVTVHLVDAGVDTGDVLYQERVSFAPEDTIATYQALQMATGIPLLAQAIEDALMGRLTAVSVDLPSQNFLPPTLWRYLWTGLTKGVW